jgi:hypothetical protein
MDSQICALAERVARLEKSNRAMKLIVAVAILAMAAMSSTPQLLAKTKSVTRMFALDATTITSQTITAQQINLVNGTGQIAAVLGTSPTGAGLVFVDQSGKWLLALGDNQNGGKTSAGLVAFDGNAALAGNGVPRAVLGVSGDGAALVALNGAGQPALVSGVNADGTGSGSFALDGNGYARAGFGNGGNGAGIFAKDSNNVTRYVAGVGGDGAQAGAITFDATGKPQLALGGAGDASSAGMVAVDATGQDRFDAGYSSANGGGLVVKNQTGSVIWYAPDPAGE